MLHDIVKAVVVHLGSHDLDQVLVGSNDPSVHDVGVGSLRKLVLESGVKHEVESGLLLPT